MDNISFNQIPVDVRTPGAYAEIDQSKAVQGLPLQNRRMMVFGQRLSTGTVDALIPTRILSASQAEEYFGRGSMLHMMFSVLKEANNTSEVWAIALDDNVAGVAAAGSINFSGAVTAAGTLNLYIAGIAVQIKVASGEASSVTAANLVTAITANKLLPVTAAVNGADNTQVDLTARHKGECGNDINLTMNYFQGQTLPAGLTAAITAMSGGTGNPDITTALATIDDDQYQTFVCPYTDVANVTVIETEMTDRFGAMEQKDGHVFSALNMTHAEASTYGAARNNAHDTFIAMNDAATPPWQVAAVLAAVSEFSIAIDPARPLQTLSLPGILPPPESKRFKREERDLLLRDGISTFTVDASGVVRIERVITTYQTNAFGVEDISLLDYNTVATLSYIRYAVKARILLRFPRYKLANDGTAFNPGQAVVTPNIIRAELHALFKELETVAIVENYEQFKADLIVVRSTVDPNRVNCIFPPDIVNQFRVFAAAIQPRL